MQDKKFELVLYETENGKQDTENGGMEPAGLVEFSIILPENMPHYDRG